MTESLRRFLDCRQVSEAAQRSKGDSARLTRSSLPCKYALVASLEVWRLGVSQIGGCSLPYPRMCVELDLIDLELIGTRDLYPLGALQSRWRPPKPPKPPKPRSKPSYNLYYISKLNNGNRLAGGSHQLSYVSLWLLGVHISYRVSACVCSPI